MRVVLGVLGVLIIMVVVGGVMFTRFRKHEPEKGQSSIEKINLPDPVFSSPISVEGALSKRKSVRAFHDEPLSISDVSQLLWAAQDITRPGGYRTAPSAGALYPLEVYLLVGDVTGLDSGLYRYEPEPHVLQMIKEGDYRDELCQAALNQEAIRDAPAVMIITGIYERTTGKYGGRGRQYVHMEVGSVSQNIYLQVVSLNLGTVFIGAFYDGEVQKVLGLGENELPFSIMPVGHPEVE